MHDGSEGLLGFDPIFPLKPHLGADFESVDRRLRDAIDRRYQVPAWTAEDYRLHKHADNLAAAAEAFHVAGWSLSDMRDSLSISLHPIADDPLPLLDGFKSWEPWPPRLAAALFLAKLAELTGPDGDWTDAADLSRVAAREMAIRDRALAFSRLPPAKTKGLVAPPTGNSLTDIFVSID